MLDKFTISNSVGCVATPTEQAPGAGVNASSLGADLDPLGELSFRREQAPRRRVLEEPASSWRPVCVCPADDFVLNPGSAVCERCMADAT